MEGIIADVAWFDGNYEGPDGWYRTLYWNYDDGSYSECDTDGNHEPCEREDIPTIEEEQKSWNEYYAYVGETGKDPLNQVAGVKGYFDTIELWTFDIARSIVGTVIRRWRRGRGEWHNGGRDSLPEYVCEFMFVNRPKEGKLYRLIEYMDGPRTYEEWRTMISDCSEVTWGKRRDALCHVRIPERKPRCATALRRDLKRAARRRRK